MLFDPLRKVTGALLGVLLAVSVSVIAAPGARALNVDVSHFTLANGLQVVVIPDHRAPVVTNMVWYRVGASDEPAGKAGIAHFLEHLLFKGTDKLAPGEFSQIVRRNGGQDNAFTTHDYTAYYQRIAKDRLDLVTVDRDPHEVRDLHFNPLQFWLRDHRPREGLPS